MSQHYDFVLSLDLKLDTPQQVIDTLAYMTRSSDYAFDNPPDAPFFEWEAWHDWLQVPDEDTYCPGNLYRVLRKAPRYIAPDGTDVCFWTVSVRSYMLDDDFWWWMAFAEWLAPYAETEGFVGYYLEETERETPGLVFIRNGRVSVLDVDEADAKRLGA